MNVPMLGRYWAIVLFILLAMPAARDLLERSISSHMLLQLPLLVLSGWGGFMLLPGAISKWLARMDPHGIAAVLCVIFAAAIWMLPRNLDAALTHADVETLKFVTIPVLIGLPLRFGWHRLPSPVRGLVWCNLLSMLAVMGWLYAVSPVRLCNNYLASDQVVFSRYLFAVLLVLCVFLIGRVFGISFHYAGSSGRTIDQPSGNTVNAAKAVSRRG